MMTMAEYAKSEYFLRKRELIKMKTERFLIRLERMQRLGEKVQRDLRQAGDKIDAIERKLKEVSVEC